MTPATPRNIAARPHLRIFGGMGCRNPQRAPHGPLNEQGHDEARVSNINSKGTDK